MKLKCFCGSPAKFRNTVKDQKGVNGATIYVYSVCDEHWDSNPPQMMAQSQREGMGLK